MGTHIKPRPAKSKSSSVAGFVRGLFMVVIAAIVVAVAVVKLVS